MEHHYTSLPAPPVLRTVEIRKGRDGIAVYPIWDDVDRPDTYGVLCKRLHTAQRLAIAFIDGRAYDNARIMTDRDGKSYVSFRPKIRGHRMSEDLKAIGY